MSFNELDLAILKTLVTNKKYALDFAGECDSKLFGSDVWNFANLVVGYIRTYKEIPTLRIITEKLSKGNNSKLIEHVQKVWEQVDKLPYNEKEYKHDLEKIKKRFAEKEISNITSKLQQLDPGNVDVTKTLAEMQKTIQSIKGLNQVKAYERKTLKEALPSFVERFNAKRLNPNIDAGLKTGYSFFDHATNGVKAADFVIIAGESGFGKSLFLNNMAIQTWMQGNTIDDLNDFKPGKNVVYFSLEMPYEDCFNRLLSRLSGVPSRKIENASLDKDEFLKIKKVLDFINAYPYQFEIIDIADACANDLDMILEDIQYHIDAIFVDYLGIMNPNESKEDQDWLKQGIVAYEVRAIARKRKLPVFSAVQLNRKASTKDPNDNIGLNRLARSATIATHATTVIQIENRTNEEQYPDFLYHIIKNRKGLKGKGKLIKNLACATLIDDAVVEDSTEFFMKDPDDISEKLELLDM
jgi:replicative DNA helicase